MEPLTLQLPHGDEETIECWDDDDDLQCQEDIQFRAASCDTSVTNLSARRSGHRDSISSRRSARSDLESTAGYDEDWQVQLLENDDYANEEAVASANNAGIPLPANVPRSALVGGAIKRLGRRKARKNIADDWSEDVEFPDSASTLELKDPKEEDFPETLRQVTSTAASPVKGSTSPFWGDDFPGSLQSVLLSSEGSQDNNYNADSQDVPTIKVPEHRPSRKADLSDNGSWNGIESKVDDLERDFELPAHDAPLKLSPQKSTTRSSSPFPEAFDIDWLEESTARWFDAPMKDRRSNPSSSVSIASPSVSSCLTGESEDDGLDGLIIPEGPLDLESSLKKRRDPELNLANPPLRPVRDIQESAGVDDFLRGIEIEDGDVFTPNNLSLNPNVRCKTERPASPTRRSATTITFTNAAISAKTRIPRLSSHDHSHAMHLETVSESGAPLSTFRRSHSRFGGNNPPRSSISSLPVSGATSTSPTLQTPGRRLVGTRVAKDSLASGRAPPARKPLLETERSMPAMRNMYQGASNFLSRSPRFQQNSVTNRSFTPTTCARLPMGSDFKSINRRTQAPFIPAGASEKQSHHATVKNSRHIRHTNSDSVGNTVPSLSRLSRTSHTDSRSSNDSIGANTDGVITKRTVTKPARRQDFGDGTELELFDDLPISSFAESRLVKHPTGRGAPRSVRRKLGQSQTMPLQVEPPTQPLGPITASKTQDFTPRFARDTSASRTAREQRIASNSASLKYREANSLPSLSANWKLSSTSRISSSSAALRNKKRRSVAPGTKPHLIKPMGTGVQEAKSVKGMRYNPTTFRWEGNENEKLVQDLEAASPHSPKLAPALITNAGAIQNVQVVGSMVFDPQRMCWLKLAPLQPGSNGLVAVRDEEDDVFAGLDDLDEKTIGHKSGRASGALDELGLVASFDDRSGGESSDEWPITEEFDIGPEFVKRQRAEEEKWKRKVDKWVGYGRERLGDDWQWAIRDLVKFDNVFRPDQVDDD